MLRLGFTTPLSTSITGEDKHDGILYWKSCDMKYRKVKDT